MNMPNKVSCGFSRHINSKKMGIRGDGLLRRRGKPGESAIVCCVNMSMNKQA